MNASKTTPAVWLFYTAVLLLLVFLARYGTNGYERPTIQHRGLNAKGPYTYTQASWYGHPFHGRLTANGEVYDMNAYTAASPSIPLGTFLVVNNPTNGKSVVVRINDRGPFAVRADGQVVRPLIAHPTRGLDLSKAAFASIADTDDGVVEVRYYVIEF